MTIRVHKDGDFTTMSNRHLKDKNISWKAKGLLSYLLSKPDDWQIYLEHLKDESTDGRDSTASALKELEESGYIVRTPLKDDKKRFRGYDYDVYENPKDAPCRVFRSGSAVAEKPKTGNPKTEKPTLLNTELTNRLNKPNTETLKSEPVTESEISFSKKKAYYNSKLLQTGLSQNDINQCIFEDAKERKQHAALVNKLGDDYEKFFNVAFSDKFITDKGAMPSFLMNQYSSILARTKRARAAPHSNKSSIDRDEFHRACEEAGV